MFRRVFALIIALSVTTPAFADFQPEKFLPTKFDPVEESLEQLLNEGWQGEMLAGLGGLAVYLHKDNKWIFCQLRPIQNKAESKCNALN